MAAVVAFVSVVFSHMGGIDEIATFAVPAAAIILFLRRSERKAQERRAAQAAADVEALSSDR